MKFSSKRMSLYIYLALIEADFWYLKKKKNVNTKNLLAEGKECNNRRSSPASTRSFLLYYDINSCSAYIALLQ